MTTDSAVPAAPLEGRWDLEATDVQGIERALVTLRKQYGSAAAAREGHAGTRNSVANLVIYAASDADAEQATATMSQLAGAHPSRTILLIAGLEPDEPGVRASVSAACHMDGAKRICYEEIRLHARGRSGLHLRSIVDPLLIADLPVFLWWTGDPPFRDAVFLTLARLSDHLVVDSAQFATAPTTLARLGRLVADDSVPSTIRDLNWQRLTSWRELLAQLFDPPTMTELLSNIRRVRIERASLEGGASSSPAQALLLAGWLATRLDWEPIRRSESTFSGGHRLRLRGGGHDVNVDLRGEFQKQALPGDVQSVHLEADSGDQAVVFTITRSADQEHAWTSLIVHGGAPQQRTVNFRTPSDAELVGDELESQERDTVFEESVEMAGRLAALLSTAPETAR